MDNLPAEPEPSPAPSRRHWHCEVCRQWMLPIRPHVGWRVTEVLVWTVFPVGIGLAAKGPGLVLLPLVVLMGFAILGPLHAVAAAEARCPGCNRYIRPPARRP